MGRNPVEFVKHPDTERVVNGLRLHKTSGRYYRIEGKKNRVHYLRQGRKGVDYLRQAVYEHECWQEGKEPKETVNLSIREPMLDDFGSDRSIMFDGEVPISRKDMAAYFRNQLLSDPLTRAEFADMVGIPELREIHKLANVANDLPLALIIKQYIANKTFKQPRQYHDAEMAWGEFVNSVGVENLDDVTVVGIQAYNKHLQTKPATRTRENLLLTVQGILKYGRVVFESHRAAIEQVKIKLNELCDTGIPKEPNPQPMKVKHYLALLDKSKGSKMWTALLHAALNFALHPTESAELLLSDLDFDEMSQVAYRGKTSILRVAAMWPRTATALRAYLDSDEYHQGSEYLFNDPEGRSLNVARIGAYLRRIREDSSVVFDGIRDLCRTKMGTENGVAIAWVMGQRRGEDDKYAGKSADETRKALAKVENAVFGERPTF